jgi:MtrB/PioB family decaheme-associated outer membrane protein
MFVVVLTLAALLFANAALAQTPAAPPSSPVEITGTVMPALQQFDNSANSSKLTEYRDFGDDVFVPRLTLTARNRTTGMFFDASASNLSRADASIYATVGRTGRWNVIADWTEIPHNYSNKAVTPYIQRAPGLFDVPATVPITFKRLATAAADTAGVLASDDLIAQYQRTFLGPTPLGTQTRAGHFSAGWTGSDVLNLAVTYDRRENTGSKATYGPIGDRPPRTLSVQLAEPVDYRTNDVTVAAEHQGKGYQLRAEYLLSDFGNRIDTMQWQNLYATPAAGASYDEWDRSVSVYGRRPLPPDNRYHNVTAMVGRDLPRDSRLSATATYGRLEQNETLLPYSYNVDRLAVQTLPRATADGSINTASFNADYVIAPARRLNLRAFYRFYNLDNNTPSSRWQYITSDTSNLNGTASYVNKRVSLPYAWDRHIGGAELTFRLPARNTISVTYERDSVSRVDREADTAEDIVRAVWRGRAWRGLSLEARYLLSVRDGGNYNNEVTHAGYWYLPAEANDFNNPALTFDNHPDMRRYDVSDRKRWQVDFRATATPRDVVAISAYARYRADDFNSDVRPTQPLLGTGLADETATTPGDQLGRLEDARLRFGADLFVQPTTRVNVNAFVN